VITDCQAQLRPTDRLLLFLAQGLGIGRIPLAPGTFGALLGVGWVALLLSTQNVWIYTAVTLAGLACSVWICGRAEQLLGQTDPGSVVLDEIVAMPLCYAAWLLLRIWPSTHLPNPNSLFARPSIWWSLGIYLGFRFFDIVKPWPVRQSQKLPGGWGVTIDDVLAGVYVNVGVVVAWLLLGPGL
jgi:phosphatidylglycerophosphatase A